MLDFKGFQEQGRLLLLTVDDWFTYKDGNAYKHICGVCKPVEAKDLLGFKPSNGTNWYMQVGDGDGAVFIAGCRIHYAVVVEDPPVGLPNNTLVI
jgi:hypothetical protein